MDLSSRHPATQAAMRFFARGHLREDLRELSSLFGHLAGELLDRLPDDPELTKALDKLREAKDRAVALAAVTPHHPTVPAAAPCTKES